MEIDGAYTTIDKAPDVADARLRQLFDYWASRRGGRDIPDYAEMDPTGFSALLSHCWIYDHDIETDGFRLRLVGEDVKAMYRPGITGMRLEEIVGDVHPIVAAQYRAVLTMPGVGHSAGPVYLHTIGGSGHGERLIFPLLDREGRASIVFGATIYSHYRAGEPFPEKEAVRTITPVDRIS